MLMEILLGLSAIFNVGYEALENTNYQIQENKRRGVYASESLNPMKRYQI